MRSNDMDYNTLISYIECRLGTDGSRTDAEKVFKGLDKAGYIGRDYEGFFWAIDPEDADFSEYL